MLKYLLTIHVLCYNLYTMGEIILRIPENIKIKYDIKDIGDLEQFTGKIKKYLKLRSVFHKLKSSVESELSEKEIKEIVNED